MPHLNRHLRFVPRLKSVTPPSRPGVVRTGIYRFIAGAEAVRFRLGVGIRQLIALLNEVTTT